MCHADVEIWEKRNNGRNITAESKRIKTLREKKLQVLENIGSGYHQTSKDERKK